MKSVQKEVDIYKSQNSDKIKYKFTFEKNSLTISDPFRRTAKATWGDTHQSPQWTNSLDSLMSRESIHMPYVFPVQLETLWDKFRNGDITPEQLKAGLVLLIDKINTATQAKHKK